MSENLAHFLQKLRDKRMSIDVIFHSTGGTLAISVRNDAALAPWEQLRIKQRIARARAFHSFFEVLETQIDKSEGAGLGIMILLQFLKRIGLSEEAFSIKTGNGKTISSIVIPMSAVHLEQVRVLTEVLVRDIESLPHFPENVTTLIRLTEDASATVTAISNHISNDPTLTADLLKHVNSAYYGLPSRVNSISQAVKLVGRRSLHHLLYSFGFHLIISQHQVNTQYVSLEMSGTIIGSLYYDVFGYLETGQMLSYLSGSYQNATSMTRGGEIDASVRVIIEVGLRQLRSQAGPGVSSVRPPPAAAKAASSWLGIQGSPTRTPAGSTP